MPDGNYIKFLGTAGARFAVAKQLRSSAGTFLYLDGQRILLDAGPGTLVRCAKVRPAIDCQQIDALILSHKHMDHSTDVNCLIDAMTGGGIWRRGHVYAPGDCIDGDDPVILKYLRGFPEAIVPLTPRTRYRVGDASFTTSIPHDHGVETYGFHFAAGGRRVSFLIDTDYFPELLEEYAASDILVVNVVLHKREDAPNALHLNVSQVRDILRAIRPRHTILTHFGSHMIAAGPWQIAANMSQDLGLDITAARDGMVFALE